MRKAGEHLGSRLVTLFTVIAIYAVLTHLPELERVAATLASGQITWLLAALGLQILYYAAFTWLYRCAFRTVDVDLPMVGLAPVVLASVFVNFAAPHTGTAVFIEHALRRGHSAGKSAAGAVLVGVADFGTFAAVLALGLWYLFSVHSLEPYQVVGAAFMGLTVIGWSSVLVLGLARPSALRRLLAWLQRLAVGLARRLRIGLAVPGDWAERTAGDFSESAAVIARNRAGVLLTLAAAITAHAVDIASLYAVGLAFGADLTLGSTVAAFAVGVLFWIVSVTPQGIGLVEGAMSLVLTSLGTDPKAAVAIALAFRGFTFWLPLALGYVAIRRMPWARPQAVARARPAGLRAVATLTAVMGIVNVVSAVTPSLRGRLHQLAEVLPLQVGYAGHLAAALAGFALLLVSGGLRRQKRAAWVLAMVVLTASVVSHLLKGLDYEEAVLSIGLIVWLSLARGRFHAGSDPATIQRSLTVVAGAVVFTVFYGATGFYLLDRHYAEHYGIWAAVEQTLVMFTSFQDPGLHPITGFGRWFADSIYAVAAGTLSYALLGLLRPVVMRQPATHEERERARRIVEAHGRSSLARFALLPDKAYHFSAAGSVTAYAVRGRIALALGDPIGPPEDAAAAIAEFASYCALHDWSPAYYETQPDYLEHYAAAGLSALCIGHEAVVPTAGFTLEGKAGRALRNPVNTLTRKGYTVEAHARPHDDGLLDELQSVSDEWLTLKHGSEKRFALGWFDDEYIGTCTVLAVHGPDGLVAAFANVVTEYQRNEVTVDLMRHRRSVENGTMDLLFVRLIEWARDRGHEGFNLGLAPLAGVGDEAHDPPLERVLHFIYEHINQFYSFRGLHAYKEKFRPEWSPRFLIYPSTGLLPAVWTAIVRADSGEGWPWVYLRRR
jgi:phosphatidylglycerol lysyltransferase